MNVRGAVGGLLCAALVATVLVFVRRAGLGEGETLLLALIEVASVACVWHLWRRGGVPVSRALLWTPIALVPLAGPIFYGGFFEMPEVLPPDMQSRRGGGLGFGRDN
jgi:hypothetical protein